MLLRSPSSRACALVRSFQGQNKISSSIQRNYSPLKVCRDANNARRQHGHIHGGFHLRNCATWMLGVDFQIP